MTANREEINNATALQVNTLFTRQWEQLSRILEKEGEITVSCKVQITLRDPETGEHADVDRRVKTSISFSEKYSDSTEATLDDPDQPGLFDPRADETAGEPDVDETGIYSEQGEEDAREYTEDQEPEHYAESGDIPRQEQAEDANLREVLRESRNPVQTNLGEAMHAAAAAAPLPRVQVDFGRGYGPEKYLAEFRKAAVKQGWPAVSIDLIDEQCRESIVGMDAASTAKGLRVISVLAAHTEPKPKKGRPETAPPPAPAGAVMGEEAE